MKKTLKKILGSGFLGAAILSCQGCASLETRESCYEPRIPVPSHAIEKAVQKPAIIEAEKHETPEEKWQKEFERKYGEYVKYFLLSSNRIDDILVKEVPENPEIVIDPGFLFLEHEELLKDYESLLKKFRDSGKKADKEVFRQILKVTRDYPGCRLSSPTGASGYILGASTNEEYTLEIAIDKGKDVTDGDFGEVFFMGRFNPTSPIAKFHLPVLIPMEHIAQFFEAMIMARDSKGNYIKSEPFGIYLGAASRLIEDYSPDKLEKILVDK